MINKRIVEKWLLQSHCSNSIKMLSIYKSGHALDGQNAEMRKKWQEKELLRATGK